MRSSFGTLLLLVPLIGHTLQEQSGCDDPTPTPTPLPTPTPVPTPVPDRPETTLEQLSALRFDAHSHPYTRANGQIVYDNGVALGSTLAGNNLAGVMASIKMGTFNEVDNGDAIRAVAAQYPQVVPLLWVHPSHGGSADTAERYLKEGQFAGLKVHPAIEDLPADSPLLDPYLEVAARYGVPVVIHTASDDPSWPERVGTLADRHPDVDLVLYHSGLGTDHQTAIDVVAQHPNTWLETSWVPTADILAAISSLGADRVLFGSDATVDGAGHYENNWGSGSGNGSYDAQLIALGQSLSRADYRALVVQNTARVFNLVTVHTYRPGATTVTLRFDNGSGALGAEWPMVKEGSSWWRRQVPSRALLRFQVLVDGQDVDGTVHETNAWEVWQKDGSLQTSIPATTIQVQYNVGFGHNIAIRGADWPLSWTAGEPATWSTGNIWTLTLTGVVEPLSFKALIDDGQWEIGANHTITPGATVLITPTF